MSEVSEPAPVALWLIPRKGVVPLCCLSVCLTRFLYPGQGEPGEDSKVEGPQGAPGDRVSDPAVIFVILTASHMCCQRDDATCSNNGLCCPTRDLRAPWEPEGNRGIQDTL